MHLIKRILNNSVGFTLLETLVALTITGVVTTAIMSLYLRQHENYLVQDDITTIQQNARSSIDELTKHIRMAGRKLPSGIQAIESSNSNPDTITITYRGNNCEVSLASAMPQPSAELNCAGSVSCFSDGQMAYIYDPVTSSGEFFLVTQVQPAASKIQHNTTSLSKSYAAGTKVFSMWQVKFYVDSLTDPDHPALMIQNVGQVPQVYAENITDLQFQYHLNNGSVVDNVILAEDILEVVFSVTARSERADLDKPSDPYRYRTFSSSVSLRNLAM